MDFSSWPRDQEQTFVVYEQHTNDSLKKSMTAGIIAAIALFVVLVGIYAGVEPEHKDMTKDMNMSNLTKKDHNTAAPTPPAPAADKK
ncbi:MAG TPA: hypothetical protein VGL61_06085 [Kofleriaceae bacterium]